MQNYIYAIINVFDIKIVYFERISYMNMFVKTVRIIIIV